MKQQILEQLKKLDFDFNDKPQSKAGKRYKIWCTVKELLTYVPLISCLAFFPTFFLLGALSPDTPLFFFLLVPVLGFMFCSSYIDNAVYRSQETIQNQIIDYFWDMDKLKEVFLYIHNSPILQEKFEAKKNYEQCLEAKHKNDKDYFFYSLKAALRAIQKEDAWVEEIKRAEDFVKQNLNSNISTNSTNHSVPSGGILSTSLQDAKYLYAK